MNSNFVSKWRRTFGKAEANLRGEAIPDGGVPKWAPEAATGSGQRVCVNAI